MPFTPAPQQSTAVDPTMLNSFMTEVLYQMEQLKTLVGENYKELSQKIQALSEQSDTRQQLEQLTALVNSRNSEFLQRVQSIADEKRPSLLPPSPHGEYRPPFQLTQAQRRLVGGAGAGGAVDEAVVAVAVAGADAGADVGVVAHSKRFYFGGPVVALQRAKNGTTTVGSGSQSVRP